MMIERHGPKSFEDQTRKVRKASALLIRAQVINNQYTQLEALGSGFFVSPNGWLLTSKHVANPVGRGLKANEAIIALTKSSETNAEWVAATAIGYDFPDLDVTAIKFPKAFGYVPLSPTLPVQGEQIGIFGYPASTVSFVGGVLHGDSVTPRVAQTVVSSCERKTKNFDPGTPNAFILANKRFIESQFVFVKGNSGGPIFSAKTGKIVGIVSGTDHLPQGLQVITVTENTRQGHQNPRGIEAVPFASYSYGIAIAEVTAMLPSSIYSNWWKRGQR